MQPTTLRALHAPKLACKPANRAATGPPATAGATGRRCRPTLLRASLAVSFAAPQHGRQNRGHQRRGRHVWRASATAGGEDAQGPPPALALSSSDELCTRDVAADDVVAASGNSDSDASSGSGVATLDLQLPRRSLLVQFTCNVCGGRSERLVNPVAWRKGLVIAQCQQCDAWHKLADAANLVEEIRYADLEDE